MLQYEKAIVDAGIPYDRVFRGYYPYALIIDGKVTLQDHHKIDRFSFIREFGYAIPNKEALEAIAQHGPLVEVGAGLGYWAHELQKMDVDIVTTDLYPVPPEGRDLGHPSCMKDEKVLYNFAKPYVLSEELSGVQAVQKYPDRNLLMIWPSYNENWAAQTLKEYKGKIFLYVGEYRACCADSEFFNVIEESWMDEVVNIPNWFGIHDDLYIFHKK